mmetsp:Transcript_2088/g.6237  ORF Transcript_2088/g.6237 Transcript_2088/m.6237 type:complete len:289 (-) Transcript_2088:2026-2892(-)
MVSTRTMVGIVVNGKGEVDERIDLGKPEKGAEYKSEPWRMSRTVEEEKKKKARPVGATVSWAIFLAILFVSGVMLVAVITSYPNFERDQKLAAEAFRRGMRWYQSTLRVHPLTSRAITAGVIFFLADFCAQRLKGEPFKTERLMRYSSFGFFFIGPFLYFWYSLTLRYGPGDSVIGSIEKATFEQVTMEPVCILGYIIYDGVLSRKSPEAIYARCRAEFPGLWCKNAIFWVPCNFANYYMGTPDLRVVFANTCSFFWNVYFSTIVNRVAPKLRKNKVSRMEAGEAHKS